MSRTTLVIELAPTRLEVAQTRGGKVLATSSVELDPARWDEAWKAGLRPLDGALQSALTGAGAVGRQAVVFHVSPTSATEVFSCPSRAGAASEAALLALGDQVSYDVDSNPHAVQMIARDKPAKGDTSPGNSHSLIAAESDDTAAIISAWLDRRGIEPEAIIPAAAPHIRDLVNRVLAGAGSRGTVVMLRVGEHKAALAAASPGRLRVIRHVDLDIATLTEALTRPITPALHPDGPEVRLSRAEARELLFRAGIPERGAVIDEARGIKGENILPLLQPILQRALVEVRQSLRFGLEDAERAGAEFSLVGPASAIPRLGEVLAGQLNLPFTAQPDAATPPGDLADALANRSAMSINLLPRAVTEQYGFRRIRTALWVGAAVAAIVGSIDGVLTQRHLAEAQQLLAAIQNSTQSAQALLEKRERVEARQRELDALGRAVEKAAGLTPNWAAWMKELAGLTPGAIRLDDIAMSSETGMIKCEIRGILKPGDDGQRADIGAYIKALQGSPLVSAVTLGATERSTGRDAGATKFTAAVTLVGVPRAVASAQGGNDVAQEIKP